MVKELNVEQARRLMATEFKGFGFYTEDNINHYVKTGDASRLVSSKEEIDSREAHRKYLINEFNELQKRSEGLSN